MSPDDRFFDARAVADALAPWRADLGAFALLARPEEDEVPTERADFASVRQMLRHSDSARIAAERAARVRPRPLRPMSPSARRSAAIPPPDDNPLPIASSSATSAPSPRPSSKQGPKARPAASINVPHAAPPASTSI